MKDKEPEEQKQRITSDIPNGKEEHAQHVKEVAAQLNFDAVQQKEDKPKIRNRCGSCAAFHTPFCTFEYSNSTDKETLQALHVDGADYACSRYFPRLHVKTGKGFDKAVNKL